MKKLNKLFAILIAVLGVQTLSAQTDVTSTYLTNAGFDDNSSWITGNVAQATTKAAKGWTATSSGDTWWYGGAVNYGSSYTVNGVTPPAKNPDGNAEGGALGISAGWGCTVTYKQEVTLPAGVYTLNYKVYNANTGATQANNYIGFTSSTITTYGKTTNFTANTWVEESVTFVLSSQTTGNISVGMGAISGGSGANAKLFVDGVTLAYKPFSDVTEANPVDLTSMVSNTKAAWTGATETPGYDGITMVAVYKGSDWTGDALSQTINGLPAGNYKMEVYCQAHSSWDTDAAAEGATGYTYLCANEYKLDVPIRNADGATQKQLHTFEKISITNGSLKISVVNEKKAANWISVYVKSLTFLGPDKSVEETNFKNNVAALKELSTADLPAAFVTKINNLITTYGSSDASAMTLSQLVAANEEIKSFIDLHNSITTVYSSLINLIQLCKTYADADYSNVQDEAQRTTLTTAATTASNNGNKTTTVAELTEVYNTLETARQTFVLAAYPTSGNSFDMTFKITNPSFETGDLTGWTIVQPSSDTGVKPNSNATYATTGVDGKYLFNTFWQGVPIKQTLAELPTGTYTLTVAVASDGGTVYLTADDEHSEGQMTSDKTQFIDTSIEFLCTDGETTIGVVGGADGDAAAHKGFTENGYWWYKADNFRLTRAFDASTLQSSLSALKATAANLLTKPMDPSKKSQLQTANNNADVASDNPFDLGTWAAALETAIAEAQSSVNDYSKIQEYINKTKVFVDASKVATYQTKHDNCEYTAADVETVRRELNVMRYEAASTVFPNPYEVTGWTGDLANGVRSDQHWSGETKSYFDANSWVSNFVGLKHTLSTTVTLPKGTYVLKAAGRSSSDATLSLTIKNGETIIESVDYTGKGDTGYGIDTSGAANFSAEGTYANGNAGRGWEWEFAKFELNAETTVTLHVEVDYNNIQNRFGSFSDITLWMDDDTYVTVYGKELEAPLAEAKALANTLPMGEAENTALLNAIATGEGKLSGPAELNAAVKALEDAVAAANTWRETYYAEKEKLVAQLERFEAEYNDAENGALDYMCKTRWATVINKAQAAALAKDNRTSHEGLTTAKDELKSALDAATISIGEYTELKSAIENADELGGGDDWGYEPFQKPESAKENINVTKEQAQTAYDAAEVDGEGVTTVIESLNIAINEIVLNAPKEGQRYYIKVATEDHGKKDNAWLVTLGGSGANNPTGYGINANNVVKGHLNQAFIFTQVEGNLYNISIERAEGTVYLTYGALNGSAAGWKNQQIQATTDAEKKGEFKIVPTGKNGILKILNTIDNNYLDCQDGGAIYTDTGIENEEFAFKLASENTVSLKFSSVGWATLILPFDAELPNGVKAYSCCEADGETLKLTEATYIKANAPYLMNGYEGTHVFSGYGMAEKDSYAEGLFTGTYVDYQTTANSNTYVLQNINGEVAFYLVGKDAQPMVKPNRIYMTYESTNGAAAPRFSFGRGEGTTSVENMEPTANSQQPIVVYDLMGRKVTTMEKGGMYIVNGKKVVIK